MDFENIESKTKSISFEISEDHTDIELEIKDNGT